MDLVQAQTNQRSIKSRITVVAIMSVFIALFVAAIALPIYEFFTQRSRTQDAIESLALVVGDRSTGAIVFEDDELANKNLLAFQSLAEVTEACIYTPDGDLFAQYVNTDRGIKCSEIKTEMVQQTKNRIGTSDVLSNVIEENIVLDGEVVGTIVVASDGSVLLPRIAKFVLFLLAVLALALIIATVLSSRLVGKIVNPIVSLADTANRIKLNSDFSLRVAPVESHDEINILVDSFNQMIDTLDQQRSELVSAKDNLEATVLRRTRELEDSRAMAESANNAKSVFLANMSHELRTPLTSIIGFRELLENDSRLTADQREKLFLIGQSSEHLLELINDVLDFSKIEAGQIELESEVFELRESIESAMDLVAHRAASKGIEIGYLLQAPIPELVIGDSTRLKQVLLNLLNNALKFTDQGEVVVEVSAKQNNTDSTEDDVYSFDFSVRDTGIGIAEASIQRLFKSFSQADASTTRHYGGTGLGLVICKHFVELMNGRIWVESKQGEGTTFYFSVSLPVVAESAHLPEDIYRTGVDFQSKKFLVIDDNDSSIEILKSNLSDWSMQCEHANSPKAALDLLQTDSEYDALLIDAPMLTRDGTSLLDQIRNIHNRKSIPTIVMTPLGSQRSPLIENSQTSNDFVTIHKPLKYGELFAAILRVFGHIVDDDQNESSLENRPLFDLSMAKRIPLKILLADDHPTNQKLGAMILQQLGYSASFAWDGEEVIRALEDADYDLVLMDLQMPILDGLQTTRAIHKRWPGRKVSIVAMTANAIRGDRERCIAAGMEDYISKPIDIRELVRLLELVGEKRAAEKSNVNATRQESIPSSVKTVEPSSSASHADNHDGINSSIVTLDQSALSSLLRTVGGDKQKLLILSDSVREEMPKLKIALQNGLLNNDADEVCRAAHTIKTSARYFGAQELAKLCATVEKQAASMDLRSLCNVNESIDYELGRFSIAMSELSREWAEQ